jgi:ribose 1,5-bisphosphokinase
MRDARRMSWIVDTRAFLSPRRDLIGPGRLVLVVGPSGAGKDTLIEGARAACSGDASVGFPLRVVTRPSSAAEDHDTMAVDEFTRALADGAFAMWWEAHGHRYGIRSTIDDDIRAGRTVICNASRTIVSLARRRYAFVTVVLVTAPQELLEQRLACRERPSDGSLNNRINRSAEVGSDVEADVVIRNVGKPEIGVRRMLNAIRDPGVFIVC